MKANQDFEHSITYDSSDDAMPALGAFLLICANIWLFNKFLAWFPEVKYYFDKHNVIGIVALVLQMFLSWLVLFIVVVEIEHRWRTFQHQRSKQIANARKTQPALAILPPTTRETIAETRADIDYDYDCAVKENRIHYARWVRFEGRFIILKAVAYDLVVTLFEHINDNIKNIFRLG